MIAEIASGINCLLALLSSQWLFSPQYPKRSSKGKSTQSLFYVKQVLFHGHKSRVHVNHGLLTVSSCLVIWPLLPLHLHHFLPCVLVSLTSLMSVRNPASSQVSVLTLFSLQNILLPDLCILFRSLGKRLTITRRLP